MNVLAVALEAETALPMDLVGWGSLVLALVVTVAWIAYLYR